MLAQEAACCFAYAVMPRRSLSFTGALNPGAASPDPLKRHQAHGGVTWIKQILNAAEEQICFYTEAFKL